MSLNHYELYVTSVLDLAETIVIKSNQTISTINNYIRSYYGTDAVDEIDPSTWKYYMNICGLYHPTDSEIVITSLDTQEIIPFTKESLAIHTATAEAYQYGTRYYRELITREDVNEELVLGILYPADMAEALAAKDGDVLSYPPHLVEHNETDLITNIEEWVQKFKGRWENSGFVLSDTLYPVALLGVMHLMIVPLIFNLRLKACKTPQAHSFHVSRYLASHGMLDAYIDKFTQKQAMFFYRNIAYIENNNGKRDIFNWLVENVMTDRDLPLGEYIMRHTTSSIETTYKPEIGFKRKSINPGVRATTATGDRKSISTILDKENPKAIGNADYHNENFRAIKEQFELSTSSVVMSKILESSLTDYTDSEIYSFTEVLTNHWLYLVSLDKYDTFIRVYNHRNAVETFITAKDAWIYFIFLFNQVNGTQILEIPQFFASRVQKLVKPTSEELLSFVDRKLIDEEVAQQIIDWQPNIPETIISVNGFNTVCQQIFNCALKQFRYTASQEDLYIRGQLQAMYEYMYTVRVCDIRPEPIVDYYTWLNERKLPYGNTYTKEEYQDLMAELFMSVTGSSLVSTTAKADLQKSMIKVMEQLSSYSVQYISEINAEAVKPVGWSSMRYSTIKATDSGEQPVPISYVITNDVGSLEESRTNIEVDQYVYTASSSIEASKEEVSFDTHITYTGIENSYDNLLNIGSLISGAVSFEEVYAPGPVRVPEDYEGFYDLTPEEQATIKFHDSCFLEPRDPALLDVGDTLLENAVKAFTYTPSYRRRLESFNHFYVAYQQDSIVNMTDNAQLSGFVSGHGTENAQGFSFFGDDVKLGIFKYFGNPINTNGFVSIAGNITLNGTLFGIGQNTTSLNVFGPGYGIPSSISMQALYDFINNELPALYD